MSFQEMTYTDAMLPLSTQHPDEETNAQLFMTKIDDESFGKWDKSYKPRFLKFLLLFLFSLQSKI